MKILCAYIADSVTMVYIAQLFQPAGLRNISAGDGMFHRRDNGQRRGSKGPVSLYDNDYCGNYICHSHRRKNTGTPGGASELLLVSTLITGAGAILIICVVGRVKNKKIY